MTLRRSYKATATIVFPRINDFWDPILSSLTSHDMMLRAEGISFISETPTGRSTLTPTAGGLHLVVETNERAKLNRLKYDLTGPISFIAASENLIFDWHGDATGPSYPEDLRLLRVAGITELSRSMRRIHFKGNDLARYDRPDQLHCRLIFQPKAVTEFIWPMLNDSGRVIWPGANKRPTRVYTIRRIDAPKGELDIDFALHDAAGPATRWARAASPGDIIGILGPAANGIQSAETYVLAGDETALPGIARILETLPPQARGTACIEIDSFEDQLTLQHPQGIAVHWLYRDGKPAGTTSLLLEALQGFRWPQDLSQAFFWGGCEHKAFRTIHHFLSQEVGLPRERQTFYSHWHRSLSEEEIITTGGSAYLP